MKKISFLLVLLHAPSLYAADLIGVYRDAVQQDPVYAAARAQLDSFRERIPQAAAALKPSLGFSADATKTASDTKFDVPAFGLPAGRRDFRSYSFGVQLNQALFDPASAAGARQAERAVEQAQLQFDNTTQDLLLRIARAYFEVLAAEDAVSFVIAQKAAVSEQLAAAKRNFEVGTATITDQHEAQARYDLIIAQEITVRSDLEIKRTALQQIVGRKVGDLLPLRSNVALHPPQPAEMEKWVERAQDNSLVVRIQRAGVDVAAEEVKRSKGAQSPTLGFVGSLGFNDNDGSVQFAGGTQTKRASVGLQLAMPLYQGGALTARERESQKLVDKARFDVENARRSVAQAARQAYLSVASGLAQVKALEQALISNQSAVDSNKLGYQVGVRINIDVLNAEQQLFSTKRDLAQSRYGTILSMLQLKAAAGDLAEKDLLEVNALLGVDPPSPALTPSVAPAPATNPEPALVPPEPSKPADAAHKPAGRKAKPKPAAKPAG